MEVENTLLTQKIKFIPSEQLKIYLKQSFGTYRYFYNLTINYFQEKYNTQKEKYDKLAKKRCIYGKCKCKPIIDTYFCEKHKKQKVNWKINLSHYDIRSKLLIKNKDLKDDELWQAETPYDSRSHAIKDAITAYKACLTKMKLGQIKFFDLSFKSKKMDTQILYLNYKTLNIQKNILINNKPELKFRFTSKNQKWMNEHSKFISRDILVYWERPDSYYFLIPMDFNVKKSKPTYSSVSLDPGIRTFQTFYSPEGIAGKIFDDNKKKLLNYGLLVDKLISIKDKCKVQRTKKNLNNKCRKIRKKIKDIIMDVHNKTIKWLCTNFKNIFLGKIDVKNITKKPKSGYRNLQNKSVRAMLNLSHGKFRQKLVEKANLLGVNLFFCNEAYTSKTCSKCGKIDENLGSKKEYICTDCGLHIDRDENGARNIWIRAIQHLVN